LIDFGAGFGKKLDGFTVVEGSGDQDGRHGDTAEELHGAFGIGALGEQELDHGSVVGHEGMGEGGGIEADFASGIGREAGRDEEVEGFCVAAMEGGDHEGVEAGAGEGLGVGSALEQESDFGGVVSGEHEGGGAAGRG